MYSYASFIGNSHLKKRTESIYNSHMYVHYSKCSTPLDKRSFVHPWRGRGGGGDTARPAERVCVCGIVRERERESARREYKDEERRYHRLFPCTRGRTFQDEAGTGLFLWHWLCITLFLYSFVGTCTLVTDIYYIAFTCWLTYDIYYVAFIHWIMHWHIQYTLLHFWLVSLRGTCHLLSLWSDATYFHFINTTISTFSDYRHSKFFLCRWHLFELLNLFYSLRDSHFLSNACATAYFSYFAVKWTNCLHAHTSYFSRSVDIQKHIQRAL